MTQLALTAIAALLGHEIANADYQVVQDKDNSRVVALVGALSGPWPDLVLHLGSRTALTAHLGGAASAVRDMDMVAQSLHHYAVQGGRLVETF